MNETICPICETKNCQYGQSFGDSFAYKCPRCGKFVLSGRVSASLMGYSEINVNRAAISRWIKINQNAGKPPYIDGEALEYIIKNFKLPSPVEQMNNLIIWVGVNQTSIGKFASIYWVDLLATIGCADYESFQYIIDWAIQRSLIKFDTPDGFTSRFQLTIEGWEYYNNIEKTNIDTKLAFMAMEFNNSRLDKLYESTIKPTVESTGFIIRRLDEVKRAGLIDEKMREEIQKSKFMIVDLTSENRGAYWEAGLASGINIPVIYICELSEFTRRQSHFDTSHHETIMWDDKPEGLNKFSQDLKKSIYDTFPTEAKMED